jgi:GAF domain-containing protein
VLNVALSWCLKVNSTARGNIQLMDWRLGYLTIAAHRGFDEDFVRCFAQVRARDGTACGRAISGRCSIVIEDVLTDREFAPYRAAAAEFGFRAVQSTPLISRSGAFVGVMSTHFPVRHRPTDSETQATQLLAQFAANAIIRQRAQWPNGGRGTDDQRVAESLAAVRSSWEALRQTDERQARHMVIQ